MATALKLTREQLAIITRGDPRAIKAFEDFFALVNALGAHASTHEPGGSDPLKVDAIPAVGSLRTLGTGAQKAAAGIHAGTHITGGGDVVADAVAAGNSGLMSGADKTKLDAFPANAAPLPQAAAGAGQSIYIESATGAILDLPAGGTWNYFIPAQYSPGGGGLTSNRGGAPPVPNAGIAAGGTSIGPALAGFRGYAWVWEILDAKGFDSTQPVYAMADGSFIITTDNGYPYNVLTHEQAKGQGTKHDALYDRVAAWVKEHPEMLTAEPKPEPAKADPDQQVRQEAYAEVMDDLLTEKLKDPKWQARRAELAKEKP